MTVSKTFAGLLVAWSTILWAGGCSDGAPQRALDSITAEGLSADIKMLSSDEFEGRAPSSLGEEKTIAFISQRFEDLGLEPGNHGTFLQEVPLVSITGADETRYCNK